MEHTASRRLPAGILAGVCAVLAVGAVGAGLAVGPERMLATHLLEDAIAGLLWAVLAFVWSWRGRAARIPLAVSGAWVVAATASGAAILGAPAVPSAWISTWSWGIAVGLAFTLGPLLIRPRRPPRWFVVSSVLATIVMATSFVTLPTVTIGSETAVANPLALGSSEVSALVSSAVCGILAFFALALLVIEMTSPARRRHLLPTLLSGIAALLALGIGALSSTWAPLVQVLTIPLVPVVIALSSTRPASRTLQAATEQLADAADPERALRSALEHIGRDLGIADLSIGPDPRPHALPLAHLGRVEGHLIVPPLDPWTERQVSASLPALAGLLASLRLIEELRRSRAELAITREEERRLMRRDLHDEVGPLLAAAVIQTDVADMALERAPERARRSLAKARTASADAVRALRRIARDLDPSAVDDLGLVGALDELADRLSGSADIVVAAPELDVLPASLHVTVYRIVAEAVGNAVRHGSPRVVRVRVDATEHHIVVEILDDGCGFDVHRAASGLGLASMRERVAVHGGELHLASSPQGTEVRAKIPVSA